MQSLALASAIVSPLLFKMDRAGNFDKSLELKKKGAVLKTSERRLSASSITSTVYRIPNLEDFQHNKDRVTLDLNTRQLRFESHHSKLPVLIPSTTIRGPASVKRDLWEITKLEKRISGEAFIDIELLKGAQDQVLASSYLELNSGLNEFYVTFANARKEKKTVLILVKFTEKSKKGGS